MGSESRTAWTGHSHTRKAPLLHSAVDESAIRFQRSPSSSFTARERACKSHCLQEEQDRLMSLMDTGAAPATATGVAGKRGGDGEAARGCARAPRASPGRPPRRRPARRRSSWPSRPAPCTRSARTPPPSPPRWSSRGARPLLLPLACPQFYAAFSFVLLLLRIGVHMLRNLTPSLPRWSSRGARPSPAPRSPALSLVLHLSRLRVHMLAIARLVSSGMVLAHVTAASLTFGCPINRR